MPFLEQFSILAGSLLLLVLLLTLAPHAGGAGRALARAASRAPLLDGAVALLTWVPWVAGAVLWGWSGLGAALLAQVVAYFLWVAGHELIFRREAARGPRIVTFINRTAGRWRNHAALWFTLFALPVLWTIRLAEIFTYPFLIWLLKFPRYRQGEWVNLSRHRFRGLVGHDLFWCLYCDWMTGVYALGADMLRNVESFWCPIRFPDARKNDLTRSTFPDVDLWVPADGTMEDVEELLVTMYGGGQRTWFGHPARVTALGEGGPEALDGALLEHSRNPRNRQEAAGATHRASSHTPLCGDQIEVSLRVEGDRVVAAGFTGSACPVCAASASLMTEAVTGREVEDIHDVFCTARRLMIIGQAPPEKDLGDLGALLGMRGFPQRLGCAMLPWHTLRSALASAAENKTVETAGGQE